MEGKLYYDKASGRYSFSYKDSDGELQDYGGIHCGEGFEVLLNDVWVPTRMEMSQVQICVYIHLPAMLVRLCCLYLQEI